MTTHESNYVAIQRERDALRRRLAEKDADAIERAAERERLLSDLEGARSALRRMEDEMNASKAAMFAGLRAPTGRTGRRIPCAQKSHASPGRTRSTASCLAR